MDQVRRCFILSGFIFYICFGVLYADSSDNQKVGTWCKIKRAYTGFINEKDLDKLCDMLASNDTDAGDTFIGINLVDGKATVFTVGEEVYFSDRKVWKEYVKIRRKGEITEYWTLRGAIEK